MSLVLKPSSKINKREERRAALRYQSGGVQKWTDKFSFFIRDLWLVKCNVRRSEM